MERLRSNITEFGALGFQLLYHSTLCVFSLLGAFSLASCSLEEEKGEAAASARLLLRLVVKSPRLSKWSSNKSVTLVSLVAPLGVCILASSCVKSNKIN